MTQRTHLLAAIAIVLSASPAIAQTAEVCGNGVDDDADGFADESCYPGLTAPLVDSPLSTRATGLVSPSTGSLYYPVTPDIRVRTPIGPHLSFQRTYASMISPGGAAPAYKKPMGDRWVHNYMGWLTDFGTTLIVRLPSGQDIVATFVSGCDYQTRAGQATKRILRCAGEQTYTVELLDGMKLSYSTLPFGGPIVLKQIIAPTVGGITINYNGSNQVDNVSDGTGNRVLYFSYTSNLLTSVRLEVGGTTVHTTSYGYTTNNLTSVTIGGQLAQTNVYTSNYLTQIQDGGAKSIVTFAYASATPGKIARIDTQQGMVGFELAATRTGCSGSDKTVVYFNRGNATSCSIDGDCGAGFLCGGKTGTGATGQCFRAARCMTVDKTAGHHEDLVTAVSSLGPPGQSCEGACTDVEQYLWNNSTAFVASLGTKDPSGAYTIREVNSNGLPTHVTFGDPDSTPTNGNAARDVWLKYTNASYPGLVTEILRPSELSGNTCTLAATHYCKISQIQYTNGKPTLVTEYGWTLLPSGVADDYTFSTTYSYDNYGRLYQIDGPLAGNGDLTTFTFYSTGDPLKDWYIETINRKKDASTFVTTTALEYDFWGNPTALRGADTTTLPASAPGSLTCLTFSASRGQLTQRREMMAGQTSCANTNAADLVTTWTRDSALRLTQLTRPDGSCVLNEFDTKGRLQRTKRRDDCNAASAGDRQEYIYDAEGLVTEIQTYDAANVLTAKQPYTYFDSRKLQAIMNPVDTSKWTGIVYDSRGLVSEIDAPGALGKTRFNRDPATSSGRDGRVTSEDRYKDATTFDTWNLLYDWIGNQFRVTDGNSKVTETTRDDMGRTVKLTSADKTYPTLYVYDNASRLTTITEAFGGGSAQQTHIFTFDNRGWLLTGDYNGRCPYGASAHPEIFQQYDAPPSCPSGQCSHTGGRLAYVKVTILCAGPSQYTDDGALDQETWFSYDAAGRLVREYIKDDSGRVADHLYSWTKSGALAQVTTPSGAVLGKTFGSVGGNSDADLVTALWRTNASTPVIDAILWNPYGPLKQYNQQNQIANKVQRTAIARNLAYRITAIAVENQSNGADTFSVSIAEDAKGRVTKRDYSAAATGVQDSYFLYDNLDRVLCETTNLASSCPTSGTNIKNSRTTPYFTAAGDWNQLLRPVPGSTGGLMNSFNPSGYGSSHQMSMVRQNDGSPALGDTVLAYDARGNRTSDDNTSTLTNDRRDYTYDQRGNVINVHGKYFTGGVWHDYDLASGFDARNRRVFKSFLDNATGVQAQWFFYYDPFDRLVEVRYTPNIASSSTYSVFQLFWLADRLVLYWQIDYPTIATTRRYVGTDETTRPLDMWTWPSSGNASRVWAVNPTAWGFDTNLVGPTIFQPILFAGQCRDAETVALQDNGATMHRPPLALNRLRTYDPFTGGYLQVDQLAAETRSAYLYAETSPVKSSDPVGLNICEGPEECSSGDFGTPGYNLPSYCSLYCSYVCDNDLLPNWGCDCSVCAPPSSYEPSLAECFDYCNNYSWEAARSVGCHCNQDDSDNADHDQTQYVDDIVAPNWKSRKSALCQIAGVAVSSIVVGGAMGLGISNCSPTSRDGCLSRKVATVGGAVLGGAIGLVVGEAYCKEQVPTCEAPFTLASGAACAGLGTTGPPTVGPSGAGAGVEYCCIL